MSPEAALAVLVGLAAVLVVCLNVAVLVACRRAHRNLSSHLARLADKVASTVDAGAKVNEVRDYYEHASGELQRLLNEAHREGDRQKQDRFRRLIDRLNTLKARTVDRSAKLLDPEGEGKNKRRRRPRRRSGSSSRRSKANASAADAKNGEGDGRNTQAAGG